jgi:cAMP-dependent protein kinase regulator
MFGKLK